MALSSTASVVSYTGNGSTTAFSVTFPFQGTGTSAELEVIQRTIATGAESTLTNPTHYTVTGGSGSTGTVTADSAPADTVQWFIRRKTLKTQTVDYLANDAFPADTHELALDRLAMSVQEVQEEVSRAFKVSPTNTITTPEFTDNASTRASKVVGFSSDGNTLEAVTGRVNTVSVSTSGLTAGASPTGSASFTTSTGALSLSLGIPAGATGSSGSAGSDGSDGSDGFGGLPFTFSSSTTDSAPGAGAFRLNNATLSSVTSAFIQDTSADTSNPDVSAYLLTWDDSTTTSDRGQIIITKKAAPQNFAIYRLSGGTTDATSYVKLSLTHVVSNGSFSNSDACTITFYRTGNVGASGSGSGDLVGPSSATDNALTRYDGTTGKLVQDSNATLSDAGVLTAKNVTVGTAAEADAVVLFDGHAVDMYIGLDDSADQLVIGTGSTAGTNSILTLTDDSLTIGDGAAADTKLVYDGNAKDFYIGLDDSADVLIIGEGSTVGTNPILTLTDDSVTVGDGAATDTKIVYDGNAKDFYVGLDDSADKLVVGVGSAVGTNSILTLDDDSVTIGDGAAVDTKLVFDGNAQDYYIGLDDSADDLIIGLGSTVGTTPAVSIDENQVVTFGAAIAGATQTATVTGNVTPDFEAFSNFVLTMSGNVTLKDPSTEAVGNSGVFVFIQPSSSAGKTLAVEAQYKTAGDAAYTLSSGVNDVDIIPYFVSAAGSVIMGKITKDMVGSA